MDNVSSLIEKCEAIAIISEDAVNFVVEVLSPYYIILLSPSHSLTGCNICRKSPTFLEYFNPIPEHPVVGGSAKVVNHYSLVPNLSSLTPLVPATPSQMASLLHLLDVSL